MCYYYYYYHHYYYYYYSAGRRATHLDAFFLAGSTTAVGTLHGVHGRLSFIIPRDNDDCDLLYCAGAASRRLRYCYHFRRYYRIIIVVAVGFCCCCCCCCCFYYRRRRNYWCLHMTLSPLTLRALFPCRLYFMIIIK